MRVARYSRYQVGLLDDALVVTRAQGLGLPPTKLAHGEPSTRDIQEADARAHQLRCCDLYVGCDIAHSNRC